MSLLDHTVKRSCQLQDWTESLVWLHNVSDLVIGLAYLTIPLIIVLFVRRKGSLPFRTVHVLFAAFVLLCGLTHLLGVAVFYLSWLWTDGVVKLLTAIVSWVTIYAIYRMLPEAIRLPTHWDLQREVESKEKAINRIRSHEERFQAIFRAAYDGVITCNAKGVITSWNPGAVTIFGYHAEAMIGKTLLDIMPERYRADHTKGLARLVAGGVPRLLYRTVELHGVHRDGREFPCDLSLGRWNEGDDTYFVGVIRDTSERRRREAAIAEELRRLRDLERRLDLRKEEEFQTAMNELFTVTISLQELLNREKQDDQRE